MKVLLLDTAFAATPIYDYLVRSGHDVWVMGNRHNDLLARKAGSNWIQQDYSQVQEVEKHVLRRGIDYVVPGCTDISIDTCLRLHMNPHLLDTPETNGILSNKEEFRTLCVELGLPAPRVIPKDGFPTAGRFICKPVDAFSGRGITVFDGNDRDALEAAYAIARAASPTLTALIETFEAGELYSCSAFVDDQRLTVAFYVRDGSSANPFAVDTSYVAYGLPAQCTKALEESLEKLCSALRLKDGLLHTQFIMAGERPSIVEVSRRCPGDLYSLLIEYSTGFTYAAKYASYFIGGEQECGTTKRKHILRHTVTSIEDTIFTGLRLGTSKAVRAFFPLHAMGQDLFARQSNRAGILFCEASTHEQLLYDYELFLSRNAYDVC
jgi:hypothetical protein